jgi:hypothetical protein
MQANESQIRQLGEQAFWQFCELVVGQGKMSQFGHPGEHTARQSRELVAMQVKKCHPCYAFECIEVNRADALRAQG